MFKIISAVCQSYNNVRFSYSYCKGQHFSFSSYLRKSYSIKKERKKKKKKRGIKLHIGV